jgi:DNA-binding GntR family transcriptional regulator
VEGAREGVLSSSSAHIDEHAQMFDELAEQFTDEQREVMGRHFVAAKACGRTEGARGMIETTTLETRM